MRRKQNNKRKKRKIISLLTSSFKVLLISVVFWGSIYAAHKWIRSSHLFMCRKFEFEGNMLIEDTELYSLVKSELSKNIFTIDTKKIIASIEEIPFAETVSVSRKLPSTVKIMVEEIEPIAFIAGKEIFTLDIKGRIFPKLKPVRVHDLLIVTGISEKQLETKKAEIINVVSLLKKDEISLYNDISEIHFSGSKITMFLYKDGLPVYLNNKNIESSLMYLKSFLNFAETHTQLKKLEYIDLCFENRVIVKEET